MREVLRAGASAVDITPEDSQFLFGYPHVERYSTGVYDPLLSSALYLSNGQTEVMFIANDIIFVSKAITQRARQRIAEDTGIPESNIMITATHTHSGPVTVDYISNEADPVVPKADKKYIELFEDGIVTSAIEAYNEAQPAQLGLTIADATGIGTNRHDPSGPADMEVPVLMVKSCNGERNIGCMLICSMHPTVLHEDLTLVSSDFPGMARQYLQQHVLGGDCPVLRHTGPAGNQSSRHVTKSNTFEEAERLGALLGRAVEKVLPQIEYQSEIDFSCNHDFVDLPRRHMPCVEDAQLKLDKAIARLEQLRKTGAPRQEVRTAECDWFGAEESVTLARAASEDRLDAVYQSCLPAEVQVIKAGRCVFVGWQGEIFVEYSLAVKAQHKNTYVISLANGELQGYIVTQEAAAEGGYEASNNLFSYESGHILVDKTLEMLADW